MKFCTVINCLDGRVQLPVIRYLQERFNVDYVDSITEAGPNRILAENKPAGSVRAILGGLRISIEKHDSVAVAIAGHHDCAGNPAERVDQIMHIQKAAERLRREAKGLEIIGLWVDENWQVHEIT